MNIELKAVITCDQTGKRAVLDLPSFGGTPLSSVLRDLLKAGWRVSAKRDCNGDFTTYRLDESGWSIVQTRADGLERKVRQGLDRGNIWVTAPGVEPDPPFTKSALQQRAAAARYEQVEVPSSRVRSLESQVAYLTAQIERLNSEAVAS